MRFITLLILLFFSFTQVAFSDEPSGLLPRPEKVVVIGDSISTGFGVSTPWTEHFADALKVELVNAAVKNQETLFGLGLIDDVLAKERPSHVIILMGTNDAVRGSVSNALINLQKMVDISRKHHAEVILGTLPKINGNPWTNNQAQMISDRIPYIKGARVADIRARFGEDRSLYADTVHPNDLGQLAIAEVFMSMFEKP